ncbi:MAG: hypothetical protein JSS66_02745 [Armatimonadetes bacterium]|nr:hypothetical protein [Armatimonadota bacterium]
MRDSFIALAKDMSTSGKLTGTYFPGRSQAFLYDGFTAFDLGSPWDNTYGARVADDGLVAGQVGGTQCGTFSGSSFHYLGSYSYICDMSRGGSTLWEGGEGLSCTYHGSDGSSFEVSDNIYCTGIASNDSQCFIGRRPLLYFVNKAGVVTDLPNGYAVTGLNQADEVIGVAQGIGAFIYRSGAYEWIPDAGGTRQPSAVDINDSGHVLLAGSDMACYLYRDGGLVPLGQLGSSMIPTDLNESDAAVGTFFVDGGGSYGFLFAGDQLYELPDICDYSGAGSSATPLKIADNGAIFAQDITSKVLFWPTHDDFRAPDDLTVKLGRVNNGDAQSLADLDGDYLEVCKFVVPNSTTPPVIFEVGGTAPNGLVWNVGSHAYSLANVMGQVEQKVDFYNWSSDSYDPSTERRFPMHTQYEFSDADVDQDPSSFIRGSDRRVQARVRVSTSGPVSGVNWCVRFDEFSFRFSVPD